MPERFVGVWLYARAHHVWGVVFGLLGSCVADLLFGNLRLAFPAATGVISVPFQREVPIAFAVIAVGSLHSSMASVEATGGLGHQRHQRTHVIGVIALAAAAMWLAETVVSGPVSALIYARSVLIWAGLALISGRLFGAAASWVLPVMTIFPIVYYGRSGNGVTQWWDWTWQGAGDVPSWLVAAGSLLIGYAAFRLTPWRRRALRPR